MAYTYTTLNTTQIKLLDEYTPWAYKVHLSQLIDEALSVGTTGILPFLLIPAPSPGDPAGYGDARIGRDLYCDREGYFAQSLHCGGGYGATGWSCDTDGNTQQDGMADFSAGGNKIKYEVIPTVGTAGKQGEVTYGEDGGNWYLYVCVQDDTWRRCQLLSW